MIINLSNTARINLTHPPYDTEGLTAVLLGNKGSGKSNTMAVMAEEAHRNQIPFIFFDPNGDATSLRELGNDVVIIGNTDHPEPVRRGDYDLAIAHRDPGQFIELVLREGYSLVMDLSDNDITTDDEARSPLSTFAAMVNRHYQMAGKLRTPAFIFVDEAHCFAPQSRANKLETLSRRALGRVANDGRKRGMMLVAATQRATYLDKRIVFGANVRMFGKITYWPDYEVVKHYIPASFKQMQALSSGQVYLCTQNNYGLIQIARRQTTDLGKTPAFSQRPRKERPSKVKQLTLLP